MYVFYIERKYRYITHLMLTLLVFFFRLWHIITNLKQKKIITSKFEVSQSILL